MLGLDIAARYMAQLRPDLWNEDSALKELFRWMEEFEDEEVGSVGSGGFVLTRTEGHLVFSLKLVSMYDDETMPFIWHEKSLPLSGL